MKYPVFDDGLPVWHASESSKNSSCDELGKYFSFQYNCPHKHVIYPESIRLGISPLIRLYLLFLQDQGMRLDNNIKYYVFL